MSEICQKCQEYKDFGSEYCWFHGIGVIPVDSYSDDIIPVLIPDLLLIVFEYIGYEYYQIFNFLEPKLTLEILIQKIIDLNHQMYLRLYNLIEEKWSNYLNKNWDEFSERDKFIINLCIKDQDMILLGFKLITRLIYIVFDEYQKLQCFRIPEDFDISELDGDVRLWLPEIGEFNIEEVEYEKLSLFWSLIYRILEKGIIFYE